MKCLESRLTEQNVTDKDDVNTEQIDGSELQITKWMKWGFWTGPVLRKLLNSTDEITQGWNL